MIRARIQAVLGATAALPLALASTASAEVLLNNFTYSGTVTGTSGEFDVYGDADAAIDTITVGDTVYSQFVGPTAANSTNGPEDRFRPQTQESSGPFLGTDGSDLLGNRPTFGWSNGTAETSSVDLLFGQTIVDNDAATDSIYELFLFELSGGDEFELTAILGGTAEAPVLGNSAIVDTFTVNSSDFIGVDREVGSTLTIRLGGSAIDISETFGVSELIGVRVAVNAASTLGGDPAVLLASVPEPASLVLLAAGGCLMLGRKTRRA